MVRRKPQCAEACDCWLNGGESVAYSPLGSSKFWLTFKSLPVVPLEILFTMAYSYTWRLRPKGERTVPFSGFRYIKGSGFYAFKLRKVLGLRYGLMFALNTVSFILRLQKKFAVFSPGQWEIGDIQRTPFLTKMKFGVWSCCEAPGFGVCTCAYTVSMAFFRAE